MRTTIVNNTTHVVVIKEGSASLHLSLLRVRPMEKVSLSVDVYATYRAIMLEVAAWRYTIYDDEQEEFAEYTLFETPNQKIEIRPSKRRVPEKDIGDLAAFDAVRKDASARMKSIAKSEASLETLSNQARLCPAQCRNLVQICLDGVKKMKEDFINYEKSEDNLWRLYSSNKLVQLISSLDKLLSTLGSIQDLLQACGSNWGIVALVVSLPLPPPERMSSKFDILIKEIQWNLETIQYALHVDGGVEFKWNETKFRHVLQTIDGAKVTVAGDVELEQSRRLASEDRKYLLSELQSGSILVPMNPLLNLWWRLGVKFATDPWKAKLAAELQTRLEGTAVLSCGDRPRLIPDCFWINSADLKLHAKLAQNSISRSVWKGEWCGQVVAIGITVYNEEYDQEYVKAAVAKEAGLMLKVQHPNIVGFVGCAVTDDAPRRLRLEKDKKCSAGYIVMELMQEDLWRVVARRAKSHLGSPFTIGVTVDLLLQIVAAMVHMHNLDIMHRDLKSANCLVNLGSSSNSSSPVLKLIDFERSKELDPDAPVADHTVDTGTRQLMAPEVWGVQISDANSSQRPPYVPYSKSADVWSFGMTSFEVVTGLRPFPDCPKNSDLIEALRVGKRPSIPASVSCPEGLKALMSRCWAQEPSDRPNFKDIERALWTIKYQLEIE